MHPAALAPGAPRAAELAALLAAQAPRRAALEAAAAAAGGARVPLPALHAADHARFDRPRCAGAPNVAVLFFDRADALGPAQRAAAAENFDALVVGCPPLRPAPQHHATHRTARP